MTTLPFKHAVIEMTRRVDHLMSDLGATGSDLNEKVRSVHHILDDYEVRQTRFIGTVYHKIVDHDDFKVRGDHQRFIETCQWLIQRLESHLITQKEQRRNTLMMPAPGSRSQFLESIRPEVDPKYIGPSVTGIGIVCLTVLPFFCTRTIERGEWPQNIVENVVVWPEVVFWAAALMFGAYYTLRFLAKDR